MAIDLYWDNDEQTILLCEFNSAWTWVELRKVLEAIQKITDSATVEIAAIVDISRGLHISPNIIFSAEGLQNAKALLTMGREGTGPVVIVGSNPVIKRIYDFFYNLDKTALGNVRFADSVEQARRMLSNAARSV